MLKLSTILIALTLVLFFAFSGCNKDPFKPGEDNDTHPIVWQYKYDKHQIYSDVIPAMDENGNIFFSIQNGEREKDVYVFATDKDGNALWQRDYSSTNYVDITRVMYINNKVIYRVISYDDLYDDWAETIYCLSAVDGEIIWQYSPNFETNKLITAMSVTTEYMIVTANWGGEYPNINEIHYFDLQNGALVRSVDLGDDRISYITIVGNDIYLGITLTQGNDYFTPQLVKMDLTTNEIYWRYAPDYQYETDYIFKQRSIPVDANGRAFLITRNQSSGNYDITISIINTDGTLAAKITRQGGNPSDIDNDLLIDKDNNIYTVIDVYSKLSSGGNQIWEFYSGTTVSNSSCNTGCILGDNNIVYHAEVGGILNVNTIGEIAWAKYDETNFSKPGYPLLTNDGNMVVVGDVYVSCIKGDGAKIQNAPWPRVYCNNGNTSSR